MTNENLEALSLTELTEGFREAAFGLADEIDRPKKYRKFYDRLISISAEVRRRGPEARRALLPLLDCEGAGESWMKSARGAECRYRAAWELLAIEPDRALATLKALAAGWPAYQRSEARGTLANIESGFLKPT